MATLISDLFTDTNGVNLDNHTLDTNIVGSAWSTLDGGPSDTGVADTDATIQSNQLQISRSGVVGVKDVGVSTYDFTADWTTGGSTGHRVCMNVRWTDKNNLINVVFREPQDDVTIYKIVAGVITEIVTPVASTFNLSTTYALRVVVKAGNLMDVYVGGVLKHSNIDISAVASTTSVAIGTAYNPGGNALFDNVLVTNTPTLTMDNVVPGTATTFTLTGFPAAPTGALVNGQTEAITGGATSSGGSVVAIPTSDFDAGQSHVNSNWNTNYTARVSIGTFYAEDTVQITPPVPEHYGQLISGFDAANVPGAAAIGDYLYIDAALADVVADYELAFVQGQTFPLTIPFRLWDVSATAWLAAVNYEITGESLNFIFYDAFTDANGTVPASHTPNIDEYGGGWSAVEKEETPLPTPSGSVTIQSNELSIGGSYRGVSVAIGNPAHIARAYWRVAATDDALSFNFARVDADNHVTAWLRQAGQASLIQHHNGADAPGAVTVSTTFTVGQTYLIEVERDVSNVAYLRIDGLLMLTYPLPHAVSSLAYRIGVYSNDNTIYLPAFAVNSEIPVPGVDPVLSFNDATPTPGQSVIGTISPALAGAVTSVTLNGDAVAFSSATTAGATFSIMALEQFTAGGTGAANPWYENIAVVMSDGTTSVSATLQIEAPTPANYAIAVVGPYNYAPPGAEQYDSAYMQLVSGSGTLVPASFDFTDTAGGSVIKSGAFNVDTQLWLAMTTFLVGFASVSISARPRQVRRLLRTSQA